MLCAGWPLWGTIAAASRHGTLLFVISHTFAALLTLLHHSTHFLHNKTHNPATHNFTSTGSHSANSILIWLLLLLLSLHNNTTSMQQGFSPAERNPLEDTKRVVETLKKNGAVDNLHSQVCVRGGQERDEAETNSAAPHVHKQLCYPTSHSTSCLPLFVWCLPCTAAGNQRAVPQCEWLTNSSSKLTQRVFATYHPTTASASASPNPFCLL